MEQLVEVEGYKFFVPYTLLCSVGEAVPRNQNHGVYANDNILRNDIKTISSEIHETGLSGNVVPFLRPFFPLIILILLCFNVLSTVPRENRLADFLYIYFFFLYIFLLWEEKDK